MNTELNVLAFDYVSGTLRGPERRAAQQRLRSDEPFAQAVNFWEEQMMSLQTGESLPPKAETWDKIAAKLNRSPQKAKAPWWQWLSASALAAALTVIALLGVRLYNPAAMNPDYVAVLTNQQGQAQLTALSDLHDKQIWLNWESVAIPKGQSLQLWAISRRDGQPRSLVVLDNNATELALNDATARLIADASELWLTVEESGGSAIDAPSELVLAKGVCVRLHRG